MKKLIKCLSIFAPIQIAIYIAIYFILDWDMDKAIDNLPLLVIIIIVSNVIAAGQWDRIDKQNSLEDRVNKLESQQKGKTDD